jgi:hypothetical protein
MIYKPDSRIPVLLVAEDTPQLEFAAQVLNLN